MKKMISILLAVALTAGVGFAAYGLLQEDKTPSEQSKVVTEDRINASSITEEDTENMDEKLPDFFTHEGIIKSVETMENGGIQVTVGEGENAFNLHVDKNYTKVFDNTGQAVELAADMKITSYVNSNKPMLMIFPPRYNPEVVIVQTDAMGTAEWTKLDQNQLNEAGNVKFNITDETIIEDLVGNHIEQTALAGKNIIVFYGMTTRSIPAQASPSKVLVLEGLPQ